MAQMSGEYNINLNVSDLKQSTSNLASYNQDLSNELDSVKYISNEIQANWVNNSVNQSDISSSLEKINDCVNKIESVIFPVLTQYIETMNTLALATVDISNTSVDIKN